MSATYSSEVKPAPASSTATSAPRAIHGRSRSRSSAWLSTVSCSVSSITSRDGSLPASSSSPGWPSASGERLTHSRRPWGGTPAAAIARQQATSRSSRRPDAAGGGERHVRRQRDQAGRRGEARQALVADRPEVGQAHDRLEHGADRAGLEQRSEVVCGTHRFP